jgi:hypothetical protein
MKKIIQKILRRLIIKIFLVTIFQKDFKLDLYIDGKYWVECEINGEKLAKDFG